VEEKREREEGKQELDRAAVPPVGRKRGGDAKRGDKAEGEERYMEFPKGLCVISENCRDLFIKPKFPVDLKP
jgi:hypothetical protein